MRIGDRLRDLRKERNMTQRELGVVLGKSRAAIGKYETGDRLPDGATMHGICDYFDVTFDYMTGRSDYRQTEPYSVEKCFSDSSAITYNGQMLGEKEKKAIMSMIDTVIALSRNEEEHK